MAWYQNKRTNVKWEIVDERGLEIAELDDDMVEISGPDAEVPQAGDDQEPQEGSDALDMMSKAELRDLAKSMGISVTGRNMDALKAAIRSAE